MLLGIPGDNTYSNYSEAQRVEGLSGEREASCRRLTRDEWARVHAKHGSATTSARAS
jgi:hypothetical protein